MAKRKTKTGRSSASSVRLKGRSATRRARKQAVTLAVGRFFVPTIIIGVLIVCLAFLASSWYETATASDFFALKTVDVRGTDRTPIEDVRRIVTSSVEKPGVWNADLGEVRT